MGSRGEGSSWGSRQPEACPQEATQCAEEREWEEEKGLFREKGCWLRGLGWGRKEGGGHRAASFQVAWADHPHLSVNLSW